MELAQMIVDYAKSLEEYDIKKNICFIQMVFCKNLKYKIYIIPKNKKLLFQYNKLALLINRNKDEIKEVIKYLCDIINNDYIRHYHDVMNSNYEGLENDIFYEFTLNIGNTVLYSYHETSINSSYNFDINDIILPLVYLVKPMNL